MIPGNTGTRVRIISWKLQLKRFRKNWTKFKQKQLNKEAYSSENRRWESRQDALYPVHLAGFSMRGEKTGRRFLPEVNGMHRILFNVNDLC